MEKQVHVSFYASLFRTECKVLTLEEIIILIRRRRWKNEILAYRTALAEGRAEEARKLKGGLPGFTPSGVFKGGHKASAIETYSQVVGLDFDHVKDLPALIPRLPGAELHAGDVRQSRRRRAEGLRTRRLPGGTPRRSLSPCRRLLREGRRCGKRCQVQGHQPLLLRGRRRGGVLQSGRGSLPHPRKQSAEKGVDAFVARFLVPSRRWQERVTRRSTASAARRTGGAFRTPKQPHAARCACKRQTSRRQRSNRRYILLIKEI